MKAKAIRMSREGCPQAIKPFLAESVPISLSTEYIIFAIAMFDGVILCQIVDDLGYPTWQAAWLFNIVDTSIPTDWICNVFDDGTMVIGPSFIAKDQESYIEMVELVQYQVERFWKRLESEQSSG